MRIGIVLALSSIIFSSKRKRQLILSIISPSSKTSCSKKLRPEQKYSSNSAIKISKSAAKSHNSS